MRVCLFLLNLCITFLQLACGAAGEGDSENNIDPLELAGQLRSEICAMNRTQIQEFYKAQRDEENRDWQFPGADKHMKCYTITVC